MLHALAGFFNRAPLGFDDLARSLRRDRAILIPQAIDAGIVRRIYTQAVAAYAIWDHRMASGDAGVSQADASEFKQGHIPVSALPREPLEHMSQTEFLRRTVHALGCDGIGFPDALRIRRILPATMRNELVEPKIGWHQDERFSRYVDPTIDYGLMFTLWLPLVPCGVDAPGLTVVRGSDKPIVMDDPKEGWERYIDRTYGPKAAWSPPMLPGDVLVFTSRTIHGSYVTSQMTKPRYSIEMRGGINAFS